MSVPIIALAATAIASGVAFLGLSMLLAGAALVEVKRTQPAKRACPGQRPTLAGLASRALFVLPMAAWVVAMAVWADQGSSNTLPATSRATAGLGQIGSTRLPAGSTDSGRYLSGGPRPDHEPVVVAVRVVCSLANEDAAAASIEWADVVTSVVADGKTFWLFGDTFLKGEPGAWPMVQAAAAVSVDTDATDCISMTYKTFNGVAAELFPRGEGETTAWPEGAIAVEPGSVDFYFARVYRESPTEWHVGEVGLGRFDTETMTGERVVNSLWDSSSGFGDTVIGARSPILRGDDVYVFLYTSANRHLLARAPANSLADRDAYSYWDGKGWSNEPARAESLWEEPASALPTHNGLSLQYNAFLGKWVALYARDLDTLAVRVADRLTGPWSAEYQWLDCARAFEAVWPVCYNANQNWQLARDGGRTLYVTLSTSSLYAGSLLEMRLGVGIHQWVDREGARSYAAERPGPEYTDEGTAFYVSDIPVPGFWPIYAWELNGEVLYAPSSPGKGFVRGELEFFTPMAPTLPNSVTAYSPVYRWDAGRFHIYSPLPTGLESLGYSRGPIAFYAVPPSPGPGGVTPSAR